MTITQTVEIPTDRRLHLDFEVPREVPTGAIARFDFIWSPKIETTDDLKASLEKVWEICKDAPISVDNFLKMRRKDNELEEAKYRHLCGESN